MRTSRYSDSQILAMLKQNQQGTPVADICREHGVSSAQFYKWRSKFGVMDASLHTIVYSTGEADSECLY